MKKLRRAIAHNGIFVAGLLLVAAIVLPLLRVAVRPMSMQEFMLLDLLHNKITLTILRLIVFGLMLVNLCLVYGLVSSWFGRRRAGLSVVVLASLPVWLLTQLSIPRFTVVLTPLLLALWAFNKASQSSRAAGWYALSGLAVTAAWIQDPVGISIVMVLCALLLIGIKPRFAKHIARQASLVLIILIATVGALAGASWKFGLGAQDYLVRQLESGIHLHFAPQLYLQGPSTYHWGLPGVSLIPIAVAVLAGLGAWQLFVTRKRPRNAYLLVLPVLLGIVAVQFTGITALVLLSLTMIGLSIWTMTGIHYLHTSWKRVFPHNKLANNLGDLLIAIMLASLALYSFWYINKAWNRNPQMRTDVTTEWNGRL